MSPPSPPYSTPLSLATAVVFLLLSTVPLTTTAHTCSSQTPKSPSCPPFTSTTPSFPFSSSTGCGHPSFHIKCSSNHSIITINDLSFSLLRYEPNSSSLFLSPHPSSASHRNCSSSHFPSIPSRSINLSGTPFRISEAYCSRLSALKPCPPPNLPNCSHCPWECKLIKNPNQLLLHECGSAHHSVSEQGCQGDILEFFDDFLKLGIKIEWDEANSYFSDCKQRQFKNGDCGFNSSNPRKQFLCFESESRISPPWIHCHTPIWGLMGSTLSLGG